MVHLPVERRKRQAVTAINFGNTKFLTTNLTRIPAKDQQLFESLKLMLEFKTTILEKLHR